VSKPKYTPEEQEILDAIAKDRGREWADRHAELILEQAQSVGQLEDDPEPDVVALGDGDQDDEAK
jgi:hypothetical protein